MVDTKAVFKINMRHSPTPGSFNEELQYKITAGNKKLLAHMSMA